jgi:hypothetical protein
LNVSRHILMSYNAFFSFSKVFNFFAISRSYSVHFSFSTIFSISCHIPRQTMFVSHFSLFLVFSL